MLATASGTSEPSSNHLLDSTVTDLTDITASNDSSKSTNELDSIPMNLLPAGNCKSFSFDKKEGIDRLIFSRKREMNILMHRITLNMLSTKKSTLR